MGGFRGAYAAEAARIHTRATRLAGLADARHPLDAHALPELDSRVLGTGTHLDDLTDALMAAYLAGLGGEGECLPRIEHDAHV
jgi:hypothetical protein